MYRQADSLRHIRSARNALRPPLRRDVVKALALGAKMVLIGRGTLYGTAAGVSTPE